MPRYGKGPEIKKDFYSRDPMKPSRGEVGQRAVEGFTAEMDIHEANQKLPGRPLSQGVVRDVGSKVNAQRRRSPIRSVRGRR